MAAITNKTIWAIKIGVLVLAVSVYYNVPGVQDFMTTGLKYLCLRDFEGLRQFILSYGLLAPITSIALMTTQSVLPLVPGIVVTISNAWIFGWKHGALYSWTGALLGAMLDFGIARWYGRPVVERIIHEQYLHMTDKFFKRYGILTVFITRLTPVIPFKAISYGAGLTGISLAKFVFATGVGQTPAIALYSILGQNLEDSLCTVVAVTSFLIILGIIAYIYRDSIERRFISGKK